SPFQTFTNALAGTLGTGNIVGVATALAAGGAGAIFWMWVSAFFGMITGYSENVLGQIYRKRSTDGAWHGGPMYYLEHGLHAKWLAVPFALFAVLASFGMGNMTQANSIAGALQAGFGLSPLAVGIVCAAALALVAAGGIRRIGAVTEKLVPVMAFLYIAGCGILLVRFREGVPGAFADIFRGAFSLRSAAGGAGGYAVLRAMRYGVARGVFSNEAGLGSSVLVHASSSISQPVEQGMWSICEIFIDTLVICTLTAVCILATGVMGTGADGASLVMAAFCAGLGRRGSLFLAVAVTLFAFSTLLCWSYNGELAAEYLFGARCRRFYRIFFIALIPVGCVTELDLVWSISDTCNGLMAVPNLIGVVLLSGTVFRETKLYLAARSHNGELAARSTAQKASKAMHPHKKT
ncbi:MAG: alanine/glycine:cation symporter family protein, partial [Ruthenibacterium sp.]